MPADTSVKYLTNTMVGAPALSGAPGSLISMLDACLVNGWGTGVIDSLVVLSNVVTVTRSSGHPFEVGMVTQISGAVTSGGSVDGEHRITEVTTTTYKFEVTGVPDQTATGTISHKVAPLGWSKPYSSGGLIGAYRSVDAQSPKPYLKVDNTQGYITQCQGFESMSGIATGLVGAFPNNGQISGGVHWTTSNNTTPSAYRPWIIVGDGRTFYYMNNPGDISYVYFNSVGFGDLISLKPADAFGSFILGNSAYYGSISGGTTPAADLFYSAPNTIAYLYLPRNATGIGGSSGPCYRSAPTPTGSDDYWSGSLGYSLMTYPNPADNGIYLSKINITEPLAGRCLRGYFPGAYMMPQAAGYYVFSSREKVSNFEAFPGKTFMAVQHGSGPGFFDVAGPWR